MKGNIVRRWLLTGFALLMITTVWPGQAQAQGQNRPPNAPTLLSPANQWRPYIPVAYNQECPSVGLHWVNNKDPDGDPVNYYYLVVYKEDPNTQDWIPVFSNWVRSTSFSFDCDNGFDTRVNFADYTWLVAATDWPRSDWSFTWSSTWGQFGAAEKNNACCYCNCVKQRGQNYTGGDYTDTGICILGVIHEGLEGFDAPCHCW